MKSPIQLKVEVSQSYAGRLQDALGADADCCCGDAESLAAYPAEVLEKLPGSVVTFGCGNPVALAGMRPGETVLDLGSGAGLDCFLAAQQGGPEGAVIGVDFTQDMIDKATENAGKLGLGNVTFKHGDIEALPLADATVDVSCPTASSTLRRTRTRSSATPIESCVPAVGSWSPTSYSRVRPRRPKCQTWRC